MKLSSCLTILIFSMCIILCSSWNLGAKENDIRIIFRGDDIGSSHAANVGCIESFNNGIMRSVEIMVPCPWFREAVHMLRETPGLDVGVHLTLTSEWEFCKWGPITLSPTLVDKQGKFFPMTSQRNDFPPNTGFLQCGFAIEEVEKELRAQIELAKKEIANVSHLSAHMGTATCTPALRELVKKLAKEYDVCYELPVQTKRFRAWDKPSTPQEKVESMVEALETIEPGLYLFVEHPGKYTPEMRSLGHKGYWDVAIDREGVTQAFTSSKVKEVIHKRGIQLLSYADVIEEYQ